MTYLKVKDHPSLVRDADSKAILNTDLKALNKYKEERDRLRRVNNVVNENKQIRAELEQMRELLQKVLDGK